MGQKTHVSKLVVKDQATDNVTDTTPSSAEIVTALGSANERGIIGTIDDNDGDTGLYLCISSDASWYYVKLNKSE